MRATYPRPPTRTLPRRGAMHSSDESDISNISQSPSSTSDAPAYHAPPVTPSFSTPLTELFSEPALLRSIARSYDKPRSRRSDGSRSRHRSYDRSRERRSDAASHVLSVLIAEEEREVQQLKAELISVTEQLRSSLRRAAEAENAAQSAARREREAQNRVLQLENTQHQTELEVLRHSEELKRQRIQIEAMERQLTKAEDEKRVLAKQIDDAREEARRAKEAVRRCKQVISDAKAKEEGIAEGRRQGMAQGFNNGRLKGWKVGRQDGFDEGRAFGRKEGQTLSEADSRRRSERQIMMERFNQYLNADDANNNNFRRTQRWAESVSQETDPVVPVEASSFQSSSTLEPRNKY